MYNICFLQLLKVFIINEEFSEFSHLHRFQCLEVERHILPKESTELMTKRLPR